MSIPVVPWPKTFGFAEARLLEHPGHGDQKVHGRRGAGAPDLKGQISKLDTELRGIRGAERLVCIDPKTGKVTLDKGADGFQVALTHHDDLAMAGTIASHNHPRGWGEPHGSLGRNGSGPSQDDLMTAWRSGPAEMRIVGPTQTFSVKQGTDKTWGSMTAAKEQVNQDIRRGKVTDMTPSSHADMRELAVSTSLFTHDSAIRREFMADISAGRKTPQQAEAMHHEELLHRAANEFGWEVTVTREASWIDPATRGPGQVDRWGEPTFVPPPAHPSGSMAGMSWNQQTMTWSATESIDRRVARELVATAVRLMEHPGHGNQKVHGRRGGVSIEGTQLENISSKTRAKIEARRQALGMPSSEQMAVEIGAAYDRASAGARKTGMTWYEDTHKTALDMAERDGHSLEGTAAVLAVCSPTRQWASNMAVAHEISSVVGENKRFEVSAELGKSARPPLAAGSYKPSDLNSGQLAWTHPQFKNSAIAAKYGLTGKEARSGRDHYGQISTSVDVLRGDKTPDQALTGVKTRNFYNNIHDPTGNNVTVDDWAYKVALTDTPVTVRYASSNGPQTYSGPASGAPYGALGSQLQGSPRVAGEGYNAGVYPVVAQAYAIAAQKAGILPQQMQAVVWESARETGQFGG